MPTSPFARACAVPGCANTPTSGRRCPAHAAVAEQSRGLASDRVHVKLYASARWRRLRQRILAAHPFCECDTCTAHGYVTGAQVVHHRVAHHGDEQLFFDETNLRALAKVCHDRITGKTVTR